jgi:ribosomal protein S18 acetylase RimI-like enzyme/ribosomal protein S27AE
MDVRRAELSDAEAIRAVARRSLEASYTLSPQTIEGAVTQWYADDTLAEKLEDGDRLVLVAERDGEVVGFTESQIVEDGEGDLLWLHVDPDFRGEGIGKSLFGATRDRLTDIGADRLRGRVLRDNPTGNTFYEDVGFVKAGEGTVTIDGTDYVENLYVEEPGRMDTVTTEDGEEVYVDHDDVDRGSVAPFMTVYSDSERTNRYGYFCSNCGNLANAMDAMGRIECPTCGNQRKPTRWDAAYL